MNLTVVRAGRVRTALLRVLRCYEPHFYFTCNITASFSLTRQLFSEGATMIRKFLNRRVIDQGSNKLPFPILSLLEQK